jgi:mannose-1-phosphate guanylyltransferase/mannose-6-phosphate isomerase
MKIIPVILSGGSGTRLWPLSRRGHPKQYLSLVGEHTMLQETILRLKGIAGLTAPLVICNNEHRFLVAGQLQKIGITDATILLEPVGRNTAPAIAAAALQAIQTNDDEDVVLLVLSADHVIQDTLAFHKSVDTAAEQAGNGKLVTFGIVPSDANTAYGYIHKGERIGEAFMVRQFVEKPNQNTANLYLQSKEYLWNSGMFMFKATTLIEELSFHSSSIIHAVKDSVENATQDLDFIRLEEQTFASSPSDSIDYALMEKSDNVVVVPLDALWNDIGSWSALYEIGAKDENGNVTRGDVKAIDTTNSYINASHHMVALIGVDNLIVIDTPDATLVASQDKVHEVKSIVESLQEEGRSVAHSHRKVYRPWGWFDSIEAGEHFQVKKLHVNPGGKLSLQMHHQRAEHWVITQGLATVVNGDEELTLSQGQSTYIPMNTKHSLENLQKEPLELIEVQSGTYLGEDDIIRFEDIYGRTSDD